jgi:hypothetical protein
MIFLNYFLTLHHTEQVGSSRKASYLYSGNVRSNIGLGTYCVEIFRGLPQCLYVNMRQYITTLHDIFLIFLSLRIVLIATQIRP